VGTLNRYHIRPDLMTRPFSGANPLIENMLTCCC